MRNFKAYIWSWNSKLYVKEVWLKTCSLLCTCTCVHDVFPFISRINSIDIELNLWSISHNSIIHNYFFFNKCQICQIFGNDSLAIRSLELNDSCIHWQLMGLTLLLGTVTLQKLIEMIVSFVRDLTSIHLWIRKSTSQIFPLWIVGKNYQNTWQAGILTFLNFLKKIL